MTIDTAEAEYDKIDQLRIKGILRSEKLCRTLKMGAIYWTPELAQIFTELQFWTKAIKHRQGRQIDTRHLRTLAKRSGSPPFWTMTEQDLRQHRKAVYDRYKNYCAKHEENRDKFINTLAARYEAAGKGQLKSMIKQLRQQEKSRADHCLINVITKPTTRRALTRVTAPSQANRDMRQEYTNQEDIEHACLQEGISRFTQGNIPQVLTRI
jgi:hypothetical protein